MSFSLTQQEKLRVQAATILGYHLDPVSKKDMAMIIVISAVYGIDLLAVIFMLWNRRYPPLKSKSPVLMAAAYISCVCWFIGDLQINGHVHLAGTALTNCKGIGVWVRVLLGVCTVSSLIALRSYGLYRVFKQNLPYRGLGLYLPFLAYSGCTLVYGIVAQVLSPSVTVEYISYLDICYCPKPFRGALYGYIWATWLLVALINWKIRNIKSSFNESREMAFCCLVVFVILTFNTVLQFTNPQYPFNQVQRIVSTSLDHLGTNLVWWAIVGSPLFSCLFRRKKYLVYWKSKLRKDGFQNEYEVASDTQHSSQNMTFNSRSVMDDDFFFFADTGGKEGGPEFLPNGEPRPKSAGRVADGKSTHKRQSTQSARTLTHLRRLNENNRPRIQTSQSGNNLGDPFNIPPASPATAVGTPTNDPFSYRFSNNFYPLPSYQPPLPGSRTGVLPPVRLNESQTVRPPVESSGSITPLTPDRAYVA
ncbi:hypothetical protein BX070DRAFT_41810 [Coemansia spiralis]|nr:hypothetical protein BX070DRAFT_41810 [Coemansia spiralis]